MHIQFIVSYGKFGMTGLARGLPGYGIPTLKAGFPK